MIIAVAGGKGSGKSTTCAFLLRALLRAEHRPLLAIDASPCPGLHDVLGVRLPRTVATLRHELLAAGSGVALGADVVEALLNQRVEEGDGFDLVAIGAGGGEPADLHADVLLRRSLARLAANYRGVVSDEGGGVEGLARRNLSVIDHLVVVADPSPLGVSAALDSVASAGRLCLRVQKTWLLHNHPQGAASGAASLGSLPEGLLLLGEVPHDPQLRGRAGKGGALQDPSWSSPAADAVESAVRQRLLDRSGLDTRRIVDV